MSSFSLLFFLFPFLFPPFPFSSPSFLHLLVPDSPLNLPLFPRLLVFISLSQIFCSIFPFSSPSFLNLLCTKKKILNGKKKKKIRVTKLFPPPSGPRVLPYAYHKRRLLSILWFDNLTLDTVNPEYFVCTKFPCAGNLRPLVCMKILYSR